MLVSEQVGQSGAAQLTDDLVHPVTLRELLVVGGRLARKRFDLAEEATAYDLDADPLMVAREFMQEVLLQRLK